MSQVFDNVSDFIQNRMKMSHIYQPVMLMKILQSGGQATTGDIAKAILLRDPTQLEYYAEITKRMPGRVLTKNRSITRKMRDGYELIGSDQLSDDEKDRLIDLCNERLAEFLEVRGSAPWSHRSTASRYIPGSLKYLVLKEAKFRCLVCGRSADESPLEPDHIVPRSEGGSNDISNLQALCGDCNRYKRASDDTDFRDVLSSYDDREDGCNFCGPLQKEITAQNELAYSILDPDPISSGHTLIVPKRHTANYFELYQPEKNAIERLLQEQKAVIQESDTTVTGFNVGFDVCEDAGQVESHCYLQMIPRRRWDRGTNASGVRNVMSR